MKIASRLLFATLCLAAPAAHGATLSYFEAYRYVESGPATFTSFELTPDLEIGVAGPDSRATQRTALGTGGFAVSSSIAGMVERSAAFFIINFNLDEPSAWRLSGSFALLGTAGLACVSLVDLAHRDVALVNEIIFTPPLISETRTLDFGGVLQPGSYSLEAMIYGGGDGQPTQAGVEVLFAIPEPGVPLLLLIALPFGLRRR